MQNTTYSNLMDIGKNADSFIGEDLNRYALPGNLTR
jgi:hypothetical protein